MTSTDDRIKTAYDRLTHGRAEITDGQLTVTNICLEAGVSRASFYRSAHAPDIRRALADPDDVPRPEPEQLREQVRQLNRAEKALRSQHASETRELRDTLKTYANQIQVLALHVNQLEDDNQLLQRRLQNAGDNITALPARR
jgi:septal ring factor EnvC (AmiA/AmiB activator)